tara:strand:+ start:217 stop:528 length:312 start_codon:yes stop_codon:yes gene_type:complete
MSASEYTDGDFVYVDPSKREVMGRVEWSKNGVPQKMEKKFVEKDSEEEPKKGRRRKRKKQYYPWGTYRTMKKLFRIEGKEKEIENYRPLDEAMTLSIKETYWD